MKSNKWKFLLTGAATLTLLTACSQASSQSTTTSATTTASSVSKKTTKTKQSDYFTEKDSDASYDESKASTVKHLVRLQLFQGMAWPFLDQL